MVKDYVMKKTVVQLCKFTVGSKRNVTGDNWFNSIELVDQLGDRSLTCVEKNKAEIPLEFILSKERREGSIKWNNYTFISCPKKNKGCVVTIIKCTISLKQMKTKEKRNGWIL